MKKRIIIWLQIILIISAGSFAFAAGLKSHTSRDKPNVIFVIFDTTRPDRLSCYGYKEITSPNIDALAKDSVLFSRNFTSVPLTTPSHASIFTGLYPQNHKVLSNGRRLEIRQKVLAEILRENGYSTGGFVSTSLLDKRTQMNRGFDVYSDTMGVIRGANNKRIGGGKKPAEVTVGEALDWLKSNERSPFFLWVHLYDPHGPYSPPDKYVRGGAPDKSRIKEMNEAIRRGTRNFLKANNLDGNAVIDPENMKLVNALYDGEISYADDEVGKLFSYLKQKGIYDNSVIVFMADHGEMLGEKDGCFGHAPFVYEGALRVPLVMKLPGIPPGKIDSMVRNIDVTPTILSYLNIEDKDKRDGISLLPLIENADGPRPEYVYFGTGPIEPPPDTAGKPPRRNGGKLGVRTNKWKYWRAAKESFLFNVEEDPGENSNLAQSSPHRIEELGVLLTPYENISVAGEEPKKLDKDRLAELKALGYL